MRHRRGEIVSVYSDYFAIERAARDQQNERAAWAENERRLALLASKPTLPALLHARWLAARAALRWRPASSFPMVGRRRQIWPSP